MTDQKTGEITQTRREFCSRGCRVASIAALGGSLAALLEGCSTSPTSPSSWQPLPQIQAPESNGAINVTVDAGSPLAAVGGAAIITSSAGSVVLAARTAESTFVAVTAQCTHQACLVSDISGQNYVCPCHGSQFSFDGRVVMGPALRALRQYATQFADGVLTITP